MPIETTTVNKKMYKIESPEPLTMELRVRTIAQLMGIKTLEGPALQTLLAPNSGVTIAITGTATWNGVTNANGVAVDSNGNQPVLPYGNYTVTASKAGYVTGSTTFSVTSTAATAVALTIVIINSVITITVTS
jgi:hypothetical protein